MIEEFRNKKYMMHKYWGKKPAKELNELIYRFSNEGDILLDPFAGYGGFSSEAILANRNVISNDLNPFSGFINKVLLSYNIDFYKIHEYIEIIENETAELRNYWYGYVYEGQEAEIVAALRKNNGSINKLKIILKGKCPQIEIPLTEDYINDFKIREEKYQIEDWYPTDELISNSRISAKKGMTVNSLFDVRPLACHAKLYSVISNLPASEEKDVLMLAFTSNLANCSKLVPPIKSRGEMSQGAWMTGFYIGENYLENNVFHYFKNRLSKVIAGKEEYINQYHTPYAKGEF
jgi:Predicted methyltransferase